MAHVIFDTHAFVKKLMQSGFADAQAEALSEAIQEVQEFHLSELATKRDLKEMETAQKRDLKEMETAQKRDLKEMEMAQKRDLKELELRLEAKIAESKADIIKWCVGSVFASVGLFAALVKLIG